MNASTSSTLAVAAPPKQHCRLGGSAAGIYLNCTKAPELWKGRKRLPSSYTDEGTLAHEIVEHLQPGREREGKASLSTRRCCAAPRSSSITATR